MKRSVLESWGRLVADVCEAISNPNEFYVCEIGCEREVTSSIYRRARHSACRGATLTLTPDFCWSHLLAAGLAASPEHLVFANPNLGARAGLPWDPTTPWSPDEYSSAYNWRVIRTGLSYLSLKALGRATYSTLMADTGVPVQVVQRMLGHSSMTTTLKHYVRIAQSQ